jgi:serine/threonine-protein kinase
MVSFRLVERALQERIVGATVAGKYRVRRVIGAGSMGFVCEAEHLEIGKRLAIKLIDASLAGMNDIAMRFRQEARAASLVESHHIVQVFDVGADEKLGLYLVMEYLHGQDLAAFLNREGRVDPDTAVRIAMQAARGLAKAHDAGVVHRDLKPANIFLCERDDDEPLVKILDFGISKVIDASRAESRLKLTRAGTVVGTPQYMSPEQARGFSVDMRTDVWALGLVLYEMLAGRPAYPELPTYEQFIIHLVSSPPDALAKVAPWVPEPLARVVHQAAEHDVTLRIPNCLELVRRLLEVHPLSNIRSSVVAAAEATDTWADADLGASRVAATDPGGAHSAGFAETDPRSRTAVMTERPPVDSVNVDVDDAGYEPPPPASSRVPSSGSLLASGVRDTSSDTDADYEDDAPQFFDRKAIERLASPTAGAAASPAASPPKNVPTPGPAPSPAKRLARTAPAPSPRSKPTRRAGRADASGSSRAVASPSWGTALASLRRLPLLLSDPWQRWAAAAALAVLLALVVALVLR